MSEERRGGALRRALAHRDFRLLLGGQAISATGDWLYSVALIVYVLQRTGSGGWVAATSLVRFVPYVVLSALGGDLADRFDRKRVMVVADLARAAVMGLLTLVAAARGPALLAIACAGASTVFSTAYSPAVQASTPTIVGEDDLAGANTLTSTIDSVALAIGPAIGGVLLLLGSPAIAFGVNAASFALSALFTIPIRTPLRPAGVAAEEASSLRQRIAEGVGAIRSSPTVLVLLMMAIAVTIFYGMEIVLYAVASEQLFHIGDDGLAFLWASIGVGGVVAAGITGKLAERPRQAAILATANVLTAVPMLVLATGPPSPAVYPLVAIEGATVIVSDVIFITMLQRSVSGDVLGRVFGVMDSIMVAGIMVGSVLAPLLVHTAGLRPAMVAAGGLVIAITVVALPRARVVDRTAAERARALAQTVDLLGRVAIFDAAPRPMLEALAAAAHIEHVTAGTVILREGDPADDVFVIGSGTVVVSAGGRDVREERAGDHFGEIGIVQRSARTATVTASTDCLLYRIPGADFVDAVNEVPRISGRVSSTIATRLRRTHPERAASREAG